MAAKNGSDRTIADIERDLAATRARLADNISSIIGELHPRAVAHRAVADAKSLARGQAETWAGQLRDGGERLRGKAQSGSARLEAVFRDSSGWRVERLVLAAGAVLAILAFFGVIRRSRR
ncbi:MAG: DUF3618 domain-containing protein [Propionibacteriaceae bacterium]|jgi:hypothetical protein|nr:DUF3618 domain-containing protein [Propionibacteriaceae bacterium]